MVRLIYLMRLRENFLVTSFWTREQSSSCRAWGRTSIWKRYIIIIDRFREAFTMARKSRSNSIDRILVEDYEFVKQAKDNEGRNNSFPMILINQDGENQMQVLSVYLNNLFISKSCLKLNEEWLKNWNVNLNFITNMLIFISNH